MEGMEDFKRTAADPGAYARRLKDSGRKVIGYFCSYGPEELIAAAGAHPFRIFGTGADISLADAHLQSYCCSLVRGALEDALAGRLDFLAGVVFPHTCDSIQRLSDIWRLNIKTDFFADVVMPVKLDTDSAREYMEAVLRRFKGDLEKGLGVTISDDDLKKTSSEFNRIRRALRTIYQLRSEDPCLIRGRDVYTLVKSSMIMDRSVLADKLEYLIPAVRGGAGYWNAAGRKRLLLAGGVCDHPEIYDLLEEAGGVVVYDDLCTGSRSFEADLSDEGEPLAALARRYLKRPVCPAKHVSNTARGERLVDLARQHKADGVIFLQLKFCDPHAFDYPYLKESLDKAGVPSFLYEIEDRLPGQGQLLTRFETFLQMI